MLAVVKSKEDVGIEIKDVPTPELTDQDSVLIEVGACGICGSDLHFYEYEEFVRNVLKLPVILGHEVAGTVKEVGSNVKKFNVGDRVITETWGGCGDCYFCRLGKFNFCESQTRLGQQADGGMTNYVIVPEKSLFLIPGSMPFSEAAMIEPVGVAMRAYEQLKSFKPGDNIVVLGPGPIGILTALIAEQSGANQVILTGLDVDKSRLELAESLGIDTLNVQNVNADEYIKNATNGRGAEIIIETSGGRTALNDAIKFAKQGGEIALVGIAPPESLDSTKVVMKELTIHGSWRRVPQTWERSINLVASRKIDVRPLISDQIFVSEAEEGFKRLINKEALKIIVKPQVN